MNYFILEDDKNRIQLFRENFDIPGNLVHICTDVEAAKKVLLEINFDKFYLDHDLGNRIFVPSNEPNTGYQLAKWISENNIQCQEIIIHSFNPAGAEAMKRVLPQAKWVPFNLIRKQ